VNFFTIIVVTMLKPLSDAAKRNERKRENQLIESQGVLNKYILAISTVDVNNNNQRQESDPGQDDLEANEQSPRIMVSN
jgi:hypothetical protein